MITKQVSTLIAMGGRFEAHRTFPSPLHYSVELEGMPSIEVTQDDISDMLKVKRLTAPHASEMLTEKGDHFAYGTVDSQSFRDVALKGYAHTCGVCSECGVWPLAGNAKGLAVRHGFSKDDKGGCPGKGRKLVHLLSRVPVQ